MHKKNLALIASALPIGSLIAGHAAIAQETSFEPVIVTAQKREQSIYEVPVAISAFSAEMIEKQGISDLTDIGKFVPNLNVTGFSAGHTSSANPFIRGIGLQDHLITTDPGVGVYVDGVYLGRQVGPELEPCEHRARRGAARSAGHPVRTQLDRRRHQHHHAPARRRGRRSGVADGRIARTPERRFLHEHEFLGPVRDVPDGRIPEPRRTWQVPDAREPAQGSRRARGHFGAGRAQVVAERSTFVPPHCRRQRGRQRPPSLRHADRRGAERRRVRLPATAIRIRPRIRTTTTPARSRRSR